MLNAKRFNRSLLAALFVLLAMLAVTSAASALTLNLAEFDFDNDDTTETEYSYDAAASTLTIKEDSVTVAGTAAKPVSINLSLYGGVTLQNARNISSIATDIGNTVKLKGGNAINKIVKSTSRLTFAAEEDGATLTIEDFDTTLSFGVGAEALLSLSYNEDNDDESTGHYAFNLIIHGGVEIDGGVFDGATDGTYADSNFADGELRPISGFIFQVENGALTNKGNLSLKNGAELSVEISEDLETQALLAVEISGDLKKASLVNNGTITIDESSVIENSGAITNNGAIVNGGKIVNYDTGAIVNKGTIANSGTIANAGTIANDNKITNDGNVINVGTIDNKGEIVNDGEIDNTGGTIDNKGVGKIRGNGAIKGNKPINNKHSNSGGCDAGFAAFSLLLAAPLFLRRARRG
ncbi:hypothetical protein AGMMS49957_09350 [Synergistales bacterium]|nr:hypothetical protein AGMMS49957_09350 [Synergistales bacterium]